MSRGKKDLLRAITKRANGWPVCEAHDQKHFSKEIPTPFCSKPSTMEQPDSKHSRSSFSIDSLLGGQAHKGHKIEDHEDEIEVEDTDLEEDDIIEPEAEIQMPNLVRPIPRLLNTEEATKGEVKEGDCEDAAIAAALQSSLFYSQHPSNFLYSQWLASRNSSALFGLQGKVSKILIDRGDAELAVADIKSFSDFLFIIFQLCMI